MKRIEEIEKLSVEELEQAAQGAPVPEGLAERIKNALAAESFISDKPERDNSSRLLNYSSLAMLAVAAALAVGVFLFRPAMPKDTFDDPLLAYAQVEETLNMISLKMAGGIDMVRKAAPIAGKPESIIKKINEQ